MNDIQLTIPVVIIVFRRPQLTKKVLDAIEFVRPAKLFVIADGPRASKPLDESQVQATRDLFEHLAWPCEVIKLYSSVNLGLRNRVISGLDEVFSQVESAIILEDDCLPSPDFFSFSAELLARYRDEPSVALISGNNFAPVKRERNSYYFSTHANIWGWATWSRTWQEFRKSQAVSDLSESEIQKILQSIGGRSQRSSFGKLLRLSSGLDSWAIQFVTFSYLNGLMSAVPSQNLVTNVGFGADSTHTKFESWADEIPLGNLRFPLRHPEEISPNHRQMKREARIKSLNWIRYPLIHPLDAAKRIFRYLRTLAN